MIESSGDIGVLLKKAKNIAVVGLNDNPNRPSYQISEYMKNQGYRIIPVNPSVASVFGQTSYPSIASIPKDISIDIVNIFRRSEDVPPVVDEAIQRHVGCIWLQSGIAHEGAAAKARKAGIPVVMDACIGVAHQQLSLQSGESSSH